MFDYEKLPVSARLPMQKYVEEGARPGHFLTAVLENDLTSAVTRADLSNRERLHEYVMFCLWEIPAEAWGSKEKVSNWIEK